MFVIDGQVRVFDQLLYSPQEYGPSRYFGNHFLQVGVEPVVIRATQGRIVQLSGEKTEAGKPKGVWEVSLFRDAQALALCKDAVIVAGELNQDQGKKPSFGITALGLEKRFGDVVTTVACQARFMGLGGWPSWPHRRHAY